MADSRRKQTEGAAQKAIEAVRVGVDEDLNDDKVWKEQPFGKQLVWRVREGDNPSKIIESLWGSQDTGYVDALLEANPEYKTTEIPVGARLVIPPIADVGLDTLYKPAWNDLPLEEMDVIRPSYDQEFLGEAGTGDSRYLGNAIEVSKWMPMDTMQALQKVLMDPTEDRRAADNAAHLLSIVADMSEDWWKEDQNWDNFRAAVGMLHQGRLDEAEKAIHALDYNAELKQ